MTGAAGNEIDIALLSVVLNRPVAGLEDAFRLSSGSGICTRLLAEGVITKFELLSPSLVAALQVKRASVLQLWRCSGIER